MLPKVVVYNSVSVDGAIKDFDVDIALHYEVAGRNRRSSNACWVRHC